MLDKVIRITRAQVMEKAIGLRLPEAGVGGQFPAPENPDYVGITVVASSPATIEGVCQLKVWDQHGRDPRSLPDYVVGNKYDEKLPLEGLDGRTLTWWARFSAPADTTFELKVEVWLGNTRAGDYVYRGPIEANEFEERDGRFHFKVDEGSSRALSRSAT